MKKNLFTTICIALVAMSLSAQDLYIRFNKVPDESGILTGDQSSAQLGKPIVIENEIPADAYLMDVPVEDGIYTKTLLLPAGDYEYQTVFADGTGTQGEKGAWTQGRPFSVSEEKPVVFRAKIVNNYIKFMNDEQKLYFSSYSDGGNSILLPTPTIDGGIEFTAVDPNYKGSVQGIIYAQGSTAFVADILPVGKGKYTFPAGANGKVKWLFSFNTHTFTVGNLKKLVTLLNTDSINIGDDFIAAEELAENSGIFSSTSPLLLKGKTTSVSAVIGIDGPAGAEKNNNLLKIAPTNIEARMYYTVLSENETPVLDESQVLSTTANPATAEYSTAWMLDTPVNISGTLTDGSYTLTVWYETEIYGDIIKSTEYSTAFSVDNTLTNVQQQESGICLKVDRNRITADFEGDAVVKLYSVSGQLINQTVVTDGFSQTVQQGIYLLRINNHVYKVAVK